MGLLEPEEEGQQLGAPLEKTQGGGRVTLDHWEDELEESAVTKSPSEQGGETKPDYVF